MEQKFKAFVVSSDNTLINDGDQLTPALSLTDVFEDSLEKEVFFQIVEDDFKMEIPDEVKEKWTTYGEMEEWICRNSGL